MSKHRVAVLKVVTKQLSVTAAAAEVGLSRGYLQRLLRRYREGGLEALEPRSRRPHSSPGRIPETVRERIVALRTELTARGLDAGPVTIAWHLEREGATAPSTSTIRRVLHGAGLVVPEPHKRPRSSWHRFEATMPNEVWQSDMTHWWLADGTEVEICSWLDDHSRFLLGATAFERVDGDDVVRRTHTNQNGIWVERFHQTLKRWLSQQPAARTIEELQAQLDAFRPAYDEARPHRAIGRRTPGETYRATPKALPAGPRARGHLRLRYDITDKKGAITLRRAGRLHHLKVGAVHARRRVLAIVDEHEVTVVDLGTGEFLSTHLIEPDRGYWRNQGLDPGRWPGSQTTR